ncbi:MULTISPECIES: response regulator transcription factor [unclassified Pedobacter]|uniref:response regulator transcription factor n=1 Tax=unclassified Pedobacter TaxID=2628915 RepID=UPI001E606642|nr:MULTISPECIES: response regulator transcription factor [unclassified Pedobacter]
MSNKLRIILIDDDEILRMGYESILQDEQDFLIVNSYSSYDIAKKHLSDDKPDLILLDLQIPGTTGIEALPFIKKSLPKTNIIILTVFDSPEQVFEALTLGASGYLTKNSSSSKIIDAIREVSTGGGAMSTNVARIVMHSFQKNLNSPLTKRETEVLERIANGQTKPQVAKELFIDQETVRSHVKNIYIKLDVNSKSEAIKAAKEKRFI